MSHRTKKEFLVRNKIGLKKIVIATVVGLAISSISPVSANAGRVITTISVSCVNGVLSVSNVPGGTNFVHYFNNSGLNLYSYDKRTNFAVSYTSGIYVSVTANAHNGAELGHSWNNVC